jgi:hypothetical protein
METQFKLQMRVQQASESSPEFSVAVAAKSENINT